MTPDTWTISTRCSSNGCVQARRNGTVQLRDSKLGDDSPILQFAPAAWTAFIDAIVDGTIHADQVAQ